MRTSNPWCVWPVKTWTLNRLYLPFAWLACCLVFGLARAGEPRAQVLKPWSVGKPIVTYWAGPAMTDAAAQQMAEGGWNLVWCTEAELDVAEIHGLRAQLHDGLISPATLDNPSQREKLDALIARVQRHPALYAYFLTDEPNTTNFAGLGRLVSYLRERDPAHLAYINLFPTYANNEQLGTKGDVTNAYQEHLRQYLNVVKPGLISYDHYQFSVRGDNDQYFLNLALIRKAALAANLPFLNIVQACTWTPSMRVPNADEMRYLVYTTAAYGAQGISYYVYSCPGHTGMIANADGSPTPLYHALKVLNREFSAVAAQLQPYQSLGVYHSGMLPPGTEPLPRQAVFQLDPPIPTKAYKQPQPVEGVMLGLFGPAAKRLRNQTPTHVLVVNLDYRTNATIGLTGPKTMELFDAAKGTWSSAGSKHVELRLAGGAGKLVRVKR
jgi:hypothetical protein